MKIMFGVLLLLAMVSVTYPKVNFSGSMHVTSAKAIQHPKSGKCMNVERNLGGDGIRLHLWDCNWGSTMPMNELFFLNQKDRGVQLTGARGACLYTGNNNNDPLYTINCNSNDKRQQFQFGDVGGKRFLIKQVEVGRCLRAKSNSNGAWIRTARCREGDQQQVWKICSSDGQCE